MDLRPDGGFDDLLVRGIGPAVADVFPDGVGEDEYILLDDAYRICLEDIAVTT